MRAGEGEMGSYGKLARRALETEMPVMVQVLLQVPCCNLIRSMASNDCLD